VYLHTHTHTHTHTHKLSSSEDCTMSNPDSLLLAKYHEGYQIEDLGMGEKCGRHRIHATVKVRLHWKDRKATQNTSEAWFERCLCLCSKKCYICSLSTDIAFTLSRKFCLPVSSIVWRLKKMQDLRFRRRWVFLLRQSKMWQRVV
jgi:hypothetical protein